MNYNNWHVAHYTNWHRLARRFTIAVLLCLPLIAATLDGTPAISASGNGMYPPPAYFVLPSQGAGGTVVMVHLTPSSVTSPVKPLSRTEYDIANTPLAYRIDVFADDSSARKSLQDQLAALPKSAPHYLIPTPLHGADQQAMYGVSGAYVLITLYRYFEIVAIADRKSSPAPHRLPASVSQELGNLSRLLLITSQRWASSHTNATTHTSGNAAKTSRPPAQSAPSVSPQDEYTALVPGVNFVSSALNAISQMQEQVNAGLAPPSAFESMANGLLNGALTLNSKIYNTRMTGSYAVAQRFVEDGLKYVQWTCVSVFSDHGTSYNTDYFQMAAADIQDAIQVVPALGQ